MNSASIKIILTDTTTIDERNVKTNFPGCFYITDSYCDFRFLLYAEAWKNPEW